MTNDEEKNKEIKDRAFQEGQNCALEWINRLLEEETTSDIWNSSLSNSSLSTNVREKIKRLRK